MSPICWNITSPLDLTGMDTRLLLPTPARGWPIANVDG
jgi:hypothetical protein